MALVSTPAAADADSYFALDDANAYFTARGITVWTGTDAAKEAAARRGTSYLDNQYRGRWLGYASTSTQALAWPRTAAREPLYPLYDADGFEIGSDAIPRQIKTAAMEAALLVLTGVNLEPTLARGGAIKSIGKGVGPLRKDITYMDGAPASDRYTAIQGLLRGLVTGSPGSTSGNVRLVRV